MTSRVGLVDIGLADAQMAEHHAAILASYVAADTDRLFDATHFVDGDRPASAGFRDEPMCTGRAQCHRTCQ